MKKLSEKVQKTRELLQETWINKAGNQKETFCVVQALIKTCPDIEDRERIYPFLQNLSGARWLANWNDEPGRTKEEVVQLMDDVASALMSEGL